MERHLTAGPIPAWAGETTRPRSRTADAGAHPRVGGGDVPTALETVTEQGPSPRGRGRRGRYPRRGDPGGPIPAWAGETEQVGHRIDEVGAHPRVGGGDLAPEPLAEGPLGPSPRGRGRRAPPDGDRGHDGPIPAWAGETTRTDTDGRHRGAHPRVGGGDSVHVSARVHARGPSPRGRGRHRLWVRESHIFGPIPAWAGETSRQNRLLKARWAHPRVGGGDVRRLTAIEATTGPSPRGRGRRPGPTRTAGTAGPIPAWAGETACMSARASTLAAHPRVGGGDTGCGCASLTYSGPSPRGRGRRQHRPAADPGGGPIPAWAGETRARLRMAWTRRAHPRVGGGDRRPSHRHLQRWGPSPRGRGRRGGRV